MNTSFRTASIVIGCLVLILGLGEVVQDTADVHERQSRLLLPRDELEADRERLNKVFDALHQRLQARSQIAEELIAGHLTLAQAVERFRLLNEEAVGTAEGKNKTRAAPDWLVDHVFAYVEQALQTQPEQAKAILERLEREREALQHSGS